MPSMFEDSTELIEFVEKTRVWVQFNCSHVIADLNSFSPDVDIKKVFAAPDLLLRKAPVLVIPLLVQVARLVAENDYSSSEFVSGIFHQKYGMFGIAMHW